MTKLYSKLRHDYDYQLQWRHGSEGMQVIITIY